MKRRYEQVESGEWVPYRWKGQYIRCCDCCLVHVYDFKVRKGRLWIRAVRENRATAASRRTLGVKVVRKK